MGDFFKKIGDTLSETGKSVGEKTKQVGEAAKLNARISAAERSICDNYSTIGKYYYDKYRHEPDEEIAETVNAVTASFESIVQMKKELLAIKGLVKCKNCGTECPQKDTFCGKCGAALEKPEPPAKPDEEITETEEISPEEAAETASEPELNETKE